VYSDADRDAPHVFAADEAVRLGPADPAQSYMSIERLIHAATATGAEALHPGYGFLSERPELPEACARAGIVFVGPSAAAMRALGDKIAARRLARRARVPVVPGYDGDEQQDEVLRAAATQLGLPLLIKAAAGGGGRGMRRVESREAFEAALHAARSEARAGFGDSRVLLERIVEPARHVEVQLLADAHGTALAVGDRDCSLQRRYQKVIEEAPAPEMAPALRRRLHRAAERLARAAGYTGAGTVEFLLPHDGQDAAPRGQQRRSSRSGPASDTAGTTAAAAPAASAVPSAAGTAEAAEGVPRTGQFWFLELNARLQVEHTVTEQVTGLDLVWWQLRLAAGDRLTLEAEEVQPRGHAVEARVYAEDPAAGFRPAAAEVALVRWPAGPGVRVDTGITAADQTVVPEYDALVGKVIAHAPTRHEALERLDSALAETAVLGLPTNVAFLRRVLTTADVRRGPVPTSFLGAHPELAAEDPPTPLVLAAVARAALSGDSSWGRPGARKNGPDPELARPWPWEAASPWLHLAGWRAGGERRPVRLLGPGGESYDADPQAPAAAVDLVLAPDAAGRRGWEVGYAGVRWHLRLDVPVATRIGAPSPIDSGSASGERAHRTHEPTAPGNWFVDAPLAGKVAELFVSEHAQVAAGAPLVALEAMKMHHLVTSPQPACVVRVLASAGTFVRAGDALLELELAPQPPTAQRPPALFP
jgi:acetyl/propionyl-CoA carboxylase alpha subunit